MATKNKFDYLSHITMTLTLLVAVIPFIVLIIRAWNPGITITNVLPILAPAMAAGPLALLTIKFSAKANQTPLALRLKTESENK